MIIMKKNNYPETAVEKFCRRHPEARLVPPKISDQDITALEEKLHINIPGIIKDCLQSCILSAGLVTGKMLGDFRQTYCEETGRWRIMTEEEEVSTATLKLPLMAPDYDLSDFEEGNDLFAGTGFLFLGLYNDEYYVLLDLQSGKICRVDTEQVRPYLGDETKADILRWAIPFFNTIEDLLRCFFEGELYDTEEMIFVGERKI